MPLGDAMYALGDALYALIGTYCGGEFESCIITMLRLPFLGNFAQKKQTNHAKMCNVKSLSLLCVVLPHHDRSCLSWEQTV